MMRVGAAVYTGMNGGKFMGLRSALYTIAHLMGDANAVKKGKVGKRVARRAAGKATGKTLRKLLK